MKLNCDLGEFDKHSKESSDILIMPLIDMANIACGFHASNYKIMSETVALAKKHNILIGAHPGYQDKDNFGRKNIPLSTEEIRSLVAYQLGALNSICNLHDARIAYVKPHGALYHLMMSSKDVFIAILESLKKQPFTSSLMILSSQSNNDYKKIAEKYEVSLIFEAFADRAYNQDGSLVSRELPGSIITDLEVIKRQIESFQKNKVITIKRDTLNLKIDSICVHGDTPNAVELIKHIRSWI